MSEQDIESSLLTAYGFVTGNLSVKHAKDITSTFHPSTICILAVVCWTSLQDEYCPTCHRQRKDQHRL